MAHISQGGRDLCYTIVNSNQRHTCVLTNLLVVVFVSVSCPRLSTPCALLRQFGLIH